MSITVSKSAVETEQLAEDLAKKLRAGDIVALTGDLGGGKTTFTKGLARGLKIKEPVTSPTFLLRREFPLENTNQAANLYHFDVYRLKDPQELRDLGFEDLVVNKQAIIVVEWADKVKSILPADTIWVYFCFVDDNTREIEIKNSR